MLSAMLQAVIMREVVCNKADLGRQSCLQSAGGMQVFDVTICQGIIAHHHVSLQKLC